MIERATVARPHLASPAPVIPRHVLEIAERVRAGEMSIAAANRALGGSTKTRRAAPGKTDPRKAAALAGANARLAKYRASR